MKLIFTKSNISALKMGRMKKIPWILGFHAFLVILIFISLMLIAGVALFYRYAILTSMQDPEVVEGTITFDRRAYLEVLRQWQIKNQQFTEPADKIYINPFSAK